MTKKEEYGYQYKTHLEVRAWAVGGMCAFHYCSGYQLVGDMIFKYNTQPHTL